ncbi:hypothetical protein AB7M49_005904 [Bradyrhizobium elkanii]|jgi:hypothetical protein|uniref:DUF4175 domain-containing protein n=1 Tax=Bradyrhizobium brasilense TaxID=1419277 RepID=A0A1G7FKA8_9BRAD|nr:MULTISPECIES: hypothetical protein [Bradyrhizobium]MCA6103488.1 hypothetical protein [Bradyrhizobium australafricanum]MCC8973627.1 hypothetical protein [Bradyrhizobium brasilense]WFU31748.1 hypothetical protein QA635_35505 [Bradyrhizobium australafricanum]WLA47043.1 hypothetical protein QIH80_35900 [Bradyrhizobium elkanii]WLB82675.1 hypothetical protein QIH83_08860 [Bradyrhizobium elkanii]
MVSHRSLTQIFGAPLVIAIVSTVGLISALVGDGWWDAVSWAGLGLPVLLYLVFIWRRQPN